MKLTSDQVSQLLIEKITGTIEPDDDLVIEQLLLDDAAVRAEWYKLVEDLQNAERTGFSANPDVAVQWTKLRTRMSFPPQRKYFSLARIAAAAAVIALGFSAYYYFSKPVQPAEVFASRLAPDQDRVYLQSDDGVIAYADTNAVFDFKKIRIAAVEAALTYTGSSSTDTALNTLSIPRAKNYTILLSDGTSISMNSKTVLRFPFNFTGNTREVYLDGEAYFKVAKDRSHPFILHAPGNDILVLGTEFNLNTYDSSSVKTSLVEGSVLASHANSRVTLEPGYETITVKDEFQVKKFEPMEVLSWMKGKFYFHNSSLLELSSLLTRWYKVKVVFENPSHRKKTFSGEIWKNQPVELFLENLKLSNNIPLTYENGVVVFK